MIGAVVVGDESGLGSARTTTTAAGPVTLVDPSTEPRTVTFDVNQPMEARTGLGPWAAGVGAALVLSVITGVTWSRTRRHRVASAAP